MKKVESITNTEGQHSGWIFECPGCECSHMIDNRWTFNNDQANPTFKPSLLVRFTQGEEEVKMVCHSFITNGQIRFLNDCTHKLKGTTVDLPER